MKALVLFTLLATLARTCASEPLNYYNPKGTEEDSFRPPELKRLSLPRILLAAGTVLACFLTVGALDTVILADPASD